MWVVLMLYYEIRGYKSSKLIQINQNLSNWTLDHDLLKFLR